MGPGTTVRDMFQRFQKVQRTYTLMGLGIWLRVMVQLFQIVQGRQVLLILLWEHAERHGLKISDKFEDTHTSGYSHNTESHRTQILGTPGNTIWGPVIALRVMFQRFQTVTGNILTFMGLDITLRVMAEIFYTIQLYYAESHGSQILNRSGDAHFWALILSWES